MLTDYSNVPFRNSGLRAEINLGFIKIDAIVLLPMLLALFLEKDMTLAYGLMAILVFFGVLNHFGFKTIIAIRRVRAKMNGKIRYAQKSSEIKRRVLHG